MKRKLVSCPVEATLEIISGRWRVLIIRVLVFEGTKRFGELQRLLEGISQRILIRELRALEEFGIINRTVFEQVPPRVEYSMTAKGNSLKPVLEEMSKWAKKNAEKTPR